MNIDRWSDPGGCRASNTVPRPRAWRLARKEHDDQRHDLVTAYRVSTARGRSSGFGGDLPARLKPSRCTHAWRITALRAARPYPTPPSSDGRPSVSFAWPAESRSSSEPQKSRAPQRGVGNMGCGAGRGRQVCARRRDVAVGAAQSRGVRVFVEAWPDDPRRRTRRRSKLPPRVPRARSRHHPTPMRACCSVGGRGSAPRGHVEDRARRSMAFVLGKARRLDRRALCWARVTMTVQSHGSAAQVALSSHVAMAGVGRSCQGGVFPRARLDVDISVLSVPP